MASGVTYYDRNFQRLDCCTCTSPAYDGDDGWNRDCLEHGEGANP